MSDVSAYMKRLDAASHQEKRLVVFDLDGTLIRNQSQFLFLNRLRKSGHIKPYPYLRLVAWFIAYRLGLVDTPERVMQFAFSFLKGEKCDEFNRLARDFADEEIFPAISADARRLVQQHIDYGDRVVLVSNSIEPLVERVAQRLEMAAYVATGLVVADDRFTGKIKSFPVYGAAKLAAVKSLLDRSIATIPVVAYSDHISDLPILEMADYPVAVNPCRRLHRVAHCRGWPIIFM